MSARLVFPLVACGALACGCADAFGNKDAHQPGEPLGTFHVDATEDANDCGEGALGSTKTWSFDVKLSKSDSQLYWNNGREIVAGTLGADGSFSFTTGVQMDMRAGATSGGGDGTGGEGAGGPKLPPCSIARTDQAAGHLDDASAPTAFSGTLGYAFAPTPQSSCADLVTGPDASFATLPCSMTYALSATRTEAPSE